MKKPVISAHRGAADLAPENTIPAIEKALELGVSQIEIDVRSSRDGVLYDLHDPRVNRTTDGSGYLRPMKSSRIDRLFITGERTGSGPACRIPRVEEILKRFGSRASFYFDVKPGVNLKSLLDLIARYGVEGRSLFWFKDSAQAVRLKKLNPGLPLKINVSGPEDMLEKYGLLPFDMIEIDPEAYSETLHELCRSRDVRIMVNFIGREESFAEKPKRWPVDVVNAHRIKPLIPYLENLNSKERSHV